MKKTLLTSIIVLVCSLGVFSQVTMKPHLSIGAEYGLTTGNLSNYYGSVVGGSLKLELPVGSPQFNITGTIGYTRYLVRLDYNGPLGLNAEKFIPVEIGAKYYFTKIAYFEGDAGISQNIQTNFTGSKTAFIYSPVIGISAPTNKHKSTIDIGLRFESRGNNHQVAVRLAYRFGPAYPAPEKTNKP
ncbi:MAG: hypothetical protein ABI113_11980 [Mucilaginibacter sp.]